MYFLKIPLRVTLAARRLTQHVEREPNAFRLQRARTQQRCLDRRAKNELIPEQFHRVTNGLPDHRLTRTGHEALHRLKRVCPLRRTQLHQAPRQHQSPSGCIDESTFGSAEMPFPMRRRKPCRR